MVISPPASDQGDQGAQGQILGQGSQAEAAGVCQGDLLADHVAQVQVEIGDAEEIDQPQSGADGQQTAAVGGGMAGEQTYGQSGEGGGGKGGKGGVEQGERESGGEGEGGEIGGGRSIKKKKRGSN